MMKKALFSLLLAVVSFSFGQVSQNGISVENAITGVLYAKKSVYSLNLSAFELYGVSNGSRPVTGFADARNASGLTFPVDFPTFMRDSAAVRKINSFDTKPKDKKDIHDDMESKYYLRTLG